MSKRLDYNEGYFEKHYAGWLYRRYLDLRNKFIKSEVDKSIPFGRFLEIGFGDDNLIKFFQQNFEIFGVDISEFAVNKIKRRYKQGHFKVCNVSKESLPFTEKFEIICAFNTIEHLETPRFALKNIFDFLTRNGVFIVYLPTQSNILSKFQYKIFYDVEEHVFRPSVGFLRNLLVEIGFTACKEYAGSFIPLKISNQFFIESFNLYLGFWKRSK